MNQKDINYRNEHAVVPQLDLVNFENCLENVPKTPVIYSRFASMGKTTKVSGSKIAGGIFNSFGGVLAMASGNFAAGAAMFGSGIVDTATGVVDPNYFGVNQGVSGIVKTAEERTWNHINFLRDFQPAEGYLAEILYKDGSCDEFHWGNGHCFFENGDYFEGYFADGKFSTGIYIWKSGARYWGNFDNDNCMKGNGLYIYPNGSYYHGDFNESMRHGTGWMWYLDGVYIGQWRNDVRHGYGVLKLENGKFYEGEFYDDEPV